MEREVKLKADRPAKKHSWIRFNTRKKAPDQYGHHQVINRADNNSRSNEPEFIACKVKLVRDVK